MKTFTGEAAVREYHRQCAILARQERQYQEAKPRSRFAYASHITKTKSKIAQLERAIPVEEMYVNLGYRDALDGTDVSRGAAAWCREAYDRGYDRGVEEKS